MLYAYFANPEYVNESVFEWQVAFYLIQKDADRTLDCLFGRLERFPEAPIGTALAEGAALFASEAGDLDLMRALTAVLSDKASVLRRFSKFASDANKAGDLESKKTQEWFADHYEGSYWYYYMFVDINPNR